MVQPVFAVLIGTAALPVFLVYLWFRLSRLPVSLPWFLLSLLAGIIAVFAALLLQSIIPEGIFPRTGRMVLSGIFLRTALTEELSRLVVLIPLFAVLRRLKLNGSLGLGFCTAGGLVSGLGFALIEGASYGSADMGIALLRAFTASPLHGACGARVGLSIEGFAEKPARGVMRFFSAVVIHGMYNMMILLGGIPLVLAVLAAFSFLISSLLYIRRQAGQDEGQ